MLGKFQSSFFLLFAPFLLFAQKDEVKAGLSDFNKSNFEEAKEHFDKALDGAAQLDDKALAKAYYYRAKARLELLQQGNQAVGQEATLKAFADLQEVGQFDHKQRFRQLIQIEYQVLYHSFLKEAVEQFRQGVLYPKADGGTEGAFDQAKKYIAQALQIRQQDYYPYNLLAQVQLAEGDSSKALTTSYQAIEQYTQYPPDPPDWQLGYTFARVAMLEFFHQHHSGKALQQLQLGQQLLQVEYGRLEAIQALSDQQKQQYAEVLDALQAFELEIYLHDSERKTEAIRRFAAAVKAKPQDYNLLVNYGQVLSDVSPQKAIAVYQQAIALDSLQTASALQFRRFVQQYGTTITKGK